MKSEPQGGEQEFKRVHGGMPGWLSDLSGWLLISAHDLRIPDQLALPWAPGQALHWGWSLLRILSPCILLPRPHPLFFSKEKTPALRELTTPKSSPPNALAQYKKLSQDKGYYMF